MTSTIGRREVRLDRLFRGILPASLLAVPLAAAACSRAPSKEIAEAGVIDAAVVDPCRSTLSDLVVASLPDGGGDFRYRERYSCGLPRGFHAPNTTCAFDFNDCQTLCGHLGACSCRAEDAACPGGLLVDAGPVVISCDLDCLGSSGRRPSGLVEPALYASRSALGDFFARTAYLEKASVDAFRQLALALRRIAAPRDFIAGAHAAIEDERRHARTMARLAQRFGGRPSAVRVKAPPAPSSLEAVALENAVEGCVRETYGALVASFQACRTRDREISTAMRRIATDETRHAALSWAIADWAEPKLSHGARRRIADARRATALRLERAAHDPVGDLVTVAGLPNGREQVRLLRALARTLWI